MRFVKETIGLILILVFVILIEIITSKVTENALNLLSSKIEVIENQESRENLKIAINDLSETWKNELSKLSYYMEHDELKDISKSMNLLVFSSENNDKDTIEEELNEIKFKMEHIKNKQKIKFENIF